MCSRIIQVPPSASAKTAPSCRYRIVRITVVSSEYRTTRYRITHGSSHPVKLPLSIHYCSDATLWCAKTAVNRQRDWDCVMLDTPETESRNLRFFLCASAHDYSELRELLTGLLNNNAPRLISMLRHDGCVLKHSLISAFNEFTPDCVPEQC
jgi:hypothetical protein